MRDIVEFYLLHSPSPFLRVQSSFAPVEGDLINIRGVTYIVVGRSFSVDHGDEPVYMQARCNVLVEVYKA